MKKITRSWLQVVALLLPLNSFSALAAESDSLFMSLYPDGGESFFCETKFTKLNSRIRNTALYPLNTVRRELGCGTNSQCQNNSRYRLIASDLHNRFPIQSLVDLKRRNTTFGNISTGDVSEAIKAGCALEISFQTLEPGDNLKGDIARVYLHMATTYDLPIQDTYGSLLEWHLSDPPDEAEHSRNNRIELLQGTRNQFIDNPAQAVNLNL